MILFIFQDVLCHFITKVMNILKPNNGVADDVNKTSRWTNQMVYH